MVQRRKYRYYLALTAALSYSTANFVQLLMIDYITSDDVLEMEDAQTEYSLPKIWVKCAHALLFSSARAFGEPWNEAKHCSWSYVFPLYQVYEWKEGFDLEGHKNA